jgi:hypothetical protein
MSYCLLGDDLAALAAERFGGASISTMQKKALLDGEPVLPSTGQMCTYVQTEAKDGRKTGIPDDPKWWARTCRLFRFQAAAVAALAVKADFERWYALEVLRPSGAWSGTVELNAALAAAPPQDRHFREFEDRYFRVNLNASVNALKAAFGPFPDFPGIGAGVESLVQGALANGWYKKPIFPNGKPATHLAGSGLPTPAKTERKACVPKPEAAGFVSRLLAPRLGVTGEPFGLPELLRASTYATFLKDEGERNGETLEPAGWAESYPNKDHFLVVQASVVVISDQEFVATVLRQDSGTNGGTIERISPHESFLLSVSPDPAVPLEGQLRSMLGKKFCREAASAPLRPLGFLVNLVSTKAGDKSAGGKPARDRAFFAIAVWAADISGKPMYADNVPKGSGDWDRGCRWGSLNELPVSDLANYGDRAVLHALKHPGKSRVVGNGSAWFVDANHGMNDGWKTALALPGP